MLRVKAFILSLACFLALAVGKLNPNLSFEEFCQEFECPPPGKEYGERKANFMKNYAKLLALEREQGAKLKPQKFLAMSDEEIKGYMGLKRNPNI